MSDSPVLLRDKFGLQKRSSSLRLSSRTLIRYQDAFSTIDKSGQGAIGREQLKTLLQKLGHTPSEDELQAMIDKMGNTERSDKISFSGFCRLMNKRMTDEEKEAELREVFNAFDQDKDGFINIKELKETLEAVLEENFEDLDDLIGTPFKKDGKIDYTQFRQLMSSSDTKI